MLPHEETKSLLQEFEFRGKPFNDAGIFLNEMLYEWENKNRFNPNRKHHIEYWQKVKIELEKLFNDKQPYSEWPEDD